ncbi:uncharacterized protein LOC123325714 [Neomonachus schauinslandi]|uniref:Uncharacterized protein LOC123325714 n=1 Tax=Neomonachus schauinslandi TaxID=29088 RepID=A0A8M1MU67_NEOSC|nr:uncharacterized protein LOC123325714 [Neomonachus schauinslandi]
MKTSTGALIIFSWLQLNWCSQGEKVEQHPSTLSVQQGSSSVINCSYSDSASDYFPWQESGSIHVENKILLPIRTHSSCKECNCASTDHFSVTPMFLHGKNEERYLGDAPEMKCSPGFVTVVLLMLGQTHGDSVTQTEGQMTLSEEAFLTINCTYSTTGYPTLFWYVQYPGEGPELLLKALRDKEKASKKGFEATLNSKSKSFHLEKGSVQASDSAIYYCVMSDTVMGTAGGAEHKL